MFGKRYFFILISLAALAAGGCKTGLLGGDTPAGPSEVAPPAPPVVVEGVRTSYADVVEKTSPAVVRILVEGKTKQAPAENSPFGDDFFKRFQQRPRCR